jgi:hypothetical protein
MTAAKRPVSIVAPETGLVREAGLGVFGGERYLSGRALVVLVAAVAIAVSVGILLLGNVQFPGEDGGITSLAGWQLHLGARAYVDFPADGLPPLYLLGTKWAYALFGVHWSSLVAMTALFGGLSFVALAVLVWRLGWGTTATILLPLMAVSVSVLPASFWWHNQLTAMSAALFLCAALLFVSRPQERWAQAALAGTAVLLSWSKANSAGLLLLGAALVFLFSRRLRLKGLAVLAGSGLASLLLLLALGVDVPAMLGSYFVGASRVAQSGGFATYFIVNDSDEAKRTLMLVAPAIAVLLATLVVVVRSRPRSEQWASLVLCLIGVATGFVAMGTNNDHNMVELPVIAIGISGLLRLAMPAIKSRPLAVALPALLAATLATIAVNGLGYAVDRHRIMSAGQTIFYENTTLETFSEPPFFRGLRAGPMLTGTVKDIQAVLNLNHWNHRLDASAYFGPRLLWAYPAFGIRPAGGLPLWWQEYLEGLPRTRDAVSAWVAAHFELAIFFRGNGAEGDYTWLPASLLASLHNDYDAWAWGHLVIWVAKDAVPRPILPGGAVQTR